MADIEWINQNGLCDGPHPEKRDGQWRYPRGRTAIRRFIRANGSISYELVCITSGCKFKSSPIPSVAAPQLLTRLPVFQDRHGETYGHICCYRGCGSTHIEWHHFAPRNTFGREADNYPVAPLCPEHHQHWHRIMDGYQWRRRGDRDPEEVALQLLKQELNARRAM